MAAGDLRLSRATDRRSSAVRAGPFSSRATEAAEGSLGVRRIGVGRPSTRPSPSRTGLGARPRLGASGHDHGGVEFACDLARDVRTDESRKEPVMMVAEDDHVCPGVAGCVDDRPAGLARTPHEVGLQSRGLDLVARLREQPDQLGGRRDRLALPVGDVIQGAEVPVELGIERDLENREHDETSARFLRLGDAAVERTAGRRRVVIADEDPAHGPAVYAPPRRGLRTAAELG